jgi:hypothetical protein
VPRRGPRPSRATHRHRARRRVDPRIAIVATWSGASGSDPDAKRFAFDRQPDPPRHRKLVAPETPAALTPSQVPTPSERA